MFIDEAVVNVKAGSGGNGSASFRREKYVEFGGPDGGHGGDGGSIILIGTDKYTTLSFFKTKKRFIADSGESGSGQQRHGKNGSDIRILVPLGTQVLDYQTRVLLYEIDTVGQEVILVKGGHGGAGNIAYKTSTNRAPRKFKTGTVGEEGVFVLQLKLSCDIGIIGLPNIGKSTLINTLTNTNSIVDNYRFTTLKPVLGVLEYNFKQYILGDIPGLIEGASENKGLGHRFLRHIERCRAIIHMIDMCSDNYVEDYKVIRNELGNYDEELLKKKQIIIFSRADMLSKKELEERFEIINKIFANKKFIIISSVKGMNVDKLTHYLAKFLDEIV
jgi:GTP-binding protein